MGNPADVSIDVFDDPGSIAEDIREFRDALRRREDGSLPEEEFRRFRLHRGIYGQRADQPGFSMVRVKVPYGRLTSSQLRGLGEIASDYADGVAHVTTRQDIQIHWVHLERIPDVLEALAEVGLTTREACGNTVRNIVGSSLAGVSRDELFDVTPYAHSLAKHLLRNPLNQALPRKFKISFSGSPDERDGIIPWMHDIGFVAALESNGVSARRGFTVYVGGGLGAQPRVADLFESFLPVEDVISTTEAILAVFNAFGNRENRTKARLKYVLWKLGLEEFRRKVNEERARAHSLGVGIGIPDGSVEPGQETNWNGPSVPETADPDFRFWLETNVIAQKQPGFCAVYVNPVIGDLTTEQLALLGNISDRLGEGEVRTTAQQDIIFRSVRTGDLAELYANLLSAGLAAGGARTIANVTTCPGADTCNLGITHSRALGTELTQLFRRHLDWNDLLSDLRIKISGCPNSCGQHHVASIGLHGAIKKVDGREVPSYILSIGGGVNSGQAAFGETVGRIPARFVGEAVSRLVQQFLRERLEQEDFWQFANRLGVYAFRTSLKNLTDVPRDLMSEELFIDLGEKKAFTAKTGDGECAV